MNDFEDNEHAMLTGVVLGFFHGHGLVADIMLNSVEDPTPYIRVQLGGGLQAVVVVMPGK